jgi:hypothetical protein
MEPVAMALLPAVAAKDAKGVGLLLHGRARRPVDKDAVAIHLADLLNAALGFPATAESVAVVKELLAAKTREAA